MHGDETSHFERGQQTIASRTVLQENYVAGLFTAQNAAAAQHFFEDVAVPNIGSRKRNIFAGKDALQAEIRHGRSHHAGAGELVLGFQETRGGEHHTIAIDDLSVGADKKGAVGVTVESHSEGGALYQDAFAQCFQVQRAATGIDVAAVGRRSDGDDVCADRVK